MDIQISNHPLASQTFSTHQMEYPLYNQHLFKDSQKPILIVEGEKATDVASKLLEYYCLTWLGGIGNVAKVDWTSIFE